MKKYVKYLWLVLTDWVKILKHKQWMKKETKKNPKILVGQGLKKMQSLGTGKRCFIVGNGPSLRAEDLEKIKDEDCFAANGIWKIFSQCDWRPKYFFLGDPDYANFLGENILVPMRAAKESFFVFTHFYRYSSLVQEEKNANFYYQPIPNIYQTIRKKLFTGGKPRFSNDVSKKVFSCGTITYEMLQMAIYMGYEEIYLLGIDHTYQKGAHFAGCSESDNDQMVSNLKGWERGYLKAKMVAESKGIKIMNATRGGELEVFPRVKFDLLFPEE